MNSVQDIYFEPNYGKLYEKSEKGKAVIWEYEGEEGKVSHQFIVRERPIQYGNAPLYQHEEFGYNYRMSNVIAGVVRGQYPYLGEHIAQKKAIYERYRDGFADLPVKMNPITEKTEPNYWLSAMIIDKEYMCKQVRDDSTALYIKEKGKTCPTEILEKLASYNAEGRPVWKPMHTQPMYRMHEFVTREGSGRCRTNAYIAGGAEDVGADIFARGLCLPSDNKMTKDEQDKVIKIVRSCFDV